MGSIPTRRIGRNRGSSRRKANLPREKDEKTDALASGPTGVAGSDLERRAAARLVEELESKGRSARVQEMKIPASESATITLHAALTLAATLIGMKWPAIGATICLIAAFSFYSERGLGLRLIGRAIPGRRTGNVLSSSRPGLGRGRGDPRNRI